MILSKIYGQELYITIFAFKDRKEQDKVYKKVKQLVEELQ